MTTDEIKAALERAEKATPGPWTVDRVGAVVDPRGHQVANATGQAPMHGDPDVPAAEIQRANAHLLAAARTDVPALCRDLLSAREALAKAEEAIAAAQSVGEIHFGTNVLARGVGARLVAALVAIRAALEGKP